MNDSPLFRPEPLERLARAHTGTVRLVRPVGVTALTALLLGIAIVAVAFSMWAQVPRKVRVPGVLAPDLGLIELTATEAGLLRESRVVQGQAVRAGDPMFVLELPEAVRQGPAQQDIQRTLAERERSLETQARDQGLLDAQTRQALQTRRAELQREAEQLDAELALQRQRLALAEQALARTEALRDQQFVSVAQTQARADELLSVRAQVSGLQRQQAAQARALAQVDAELRDLPIQSAVRQAALSRERAALAEAQARESRDEASRRIVVRAPSDGTVAAVMAQAGQSVDEQQRLVSLVPAQARLQAHLDAPSSAVGFVRPGQSVTLRVRAFAHQKFGAPKGVVVSVSQAPWQPAAPSPAGPSLADREPHYRITVALPTQFVVGPDGRQWPLVAGMQLEADVLLEQRRLGEWLFAPLLGWADRL